MSRHGMLKLLTGIGLVAALAVLLPATSVRAHETDQFTLPAGREFADLGRWFSDWAYQKIDDGVRKTNAKIEQAVRAGRPRAEIASLQSADEIVKAVNSEFPDAYNEIEGLDTMSNSSAMMKRYPGLVVGYEEQFTNIFQHVHFPLDPRQIFRIWHASTLKVYGTYLGTDKIGHFTDMGRHYFNAYSKALRQGMSQNAAIASAVLVGTDGPIFSERGAVGYLSAGAYSNADLVANYLGFLFYRNLTEAVTLRGEVRTPMLIRDGEYWRIAPHIERDADFFRWFISDHLNEALNPSHFESGMRKDVRRAVHDRTEIVLNRYVDEHGNRRPQRWFAEQLTAMRTYFGQEYGHHGEPHELISINDACFEDLPGHGESTSRNLIGETPLHAAARKGDRAAVRQLLDRGANVNVTVQSAEQYSPAWGDTPLHVAIAEGRRDIAEILIEAGANVNARNVRGVTPLHRAVNEPELVDLLLKHGASTDSADRIGRTPLHYAALAAPVASVQALLHGKAAVNATDHYGRTALHAAATAGHEQSALALLDAGADVNAKADLKLTPLHLAAAGGHDALVDLFLIRHCDIRAVDEFNRTALHHGAQSGSWKAVDALLANNASVNDKDAAGNTALHLASRYGNIGVTQLLAASQANARQANRVGSTPLHEAAFSGKTAIIQTIIERGGETSARNTRGQAPIDVAIAHGHRSVAPQLQQTAALTRLPDH